MTERASPFAGETPSVFAIYRSAQIKLPPSGELANEVSLRGFALHLSRKLFRYAKGSLPEGAGKTVRF